MINFRHYFLEPQMPGRLCLTGQSMQTCRISNKDSNVIRSQLILREDDSVHRFERPHSFLISISIL